MLSLNKGDDIDVSMARKEDRYRWVYEASNKTPISSKGVIIDSPDQGIELLVEHGFAVDKL